mgnify:FL=1
MKKRIPFVISLLALSIMGNAYADLDITNQPDGNGEVIFDKSSTQDNTSSGSRFLNPPRASSNTVIFEDNGNEDMTPSEINAIQAQGGSVLDAGEDAESDVNTSVVAKTNVGGDGYAQRSARNIPTMQTYGSFVEGLDNNINVLKSLPIVKTELREIRLPVLKIGSTGKNVEILSQSLVDHGFLDLAGLPLPTNYDEDIKNAVLLAQKTYGLKEDGIAGPQLYSNLSMNNGQKLKDLIAWRDQVVSFINTAKEEGSKYVIIVNIPSYTLHAINVETGEEVVQSKVIVGKPIHQTPIYRINLVALKYNPTWTPPMSVIKRSVLPNVNSRYVTSHGLRAVDGRGNSYNLNSVSPSDILRGRYTVQQPPGTSNSLGILKFETDSPDDIYLHDTNERSLFGRASRSFSLGCVRVQQWPDLAAMLLDSEKDDVFKNINKGKTYIQKVNKTPIFITYSLIDSVEGKVGHYADVYKKFK